MPRRIRRVRNASRGALDRFRRIPDASPKVPGRFPWVRNASRREPDWLRRLPNARKLAGPRSGLFASGAEARVERSGGSGRRSARLPARFVGSRTLAGRCQRRPGAFGGRGDAACERSGGSGAGVVPPAGDHASRRVGFPGGGRPRASRLTERRPPRRPTPFAPLRSTRGSTQGRPCRRTARSTRCRAPDPAPAIAPPGAPTPARIEQGQPCAPPGRGGGGPCRRGSRSWAGRVVSRRLGSAGAPLLGSGFGALPHPQTPASYGARTPSLLVAISSARHRSGGLTPVGPVGSPRGGARPPPLAPLRCTRGSTP